jgi:hypothetical protein
VTGWEIDWPAIKSIFFGGSSALLVHFLWDGWWKPGIQGRELANTIRVEITLLFKAPLLGREFMLSHPAGLPNPPPSVEAI